MRPHIILILAILHLSLNSWSRLTPDAPQIETNTKKHDVSDYQPENKNLAEVYNNIKLLNVINGIALHNAFKFYEENLIKENLSENYLAIVDYTKAANLKRYYWINLTDGKIERAFRVAHGVGSGKGLIAKQCSGINNSLNTPCGFHKYGIPYNSGKNGVSVYMHGLQNINSNSKERSIVAHPAAYVNGNYFMGAESYKTWVKNSNRLLQSLKDDNQREFDDLFVFNKSTKIIPLSLRVTDNSEGCHAFGAEDLAKIITKMKDVLSYNYFGEDENGPTKTVFQIPANSEQQIAISQTTNTDG